MSENLRVLLCTNGSDVGGQALDLGKRIALKVASAVDILVVGRSTQRMEAAIQGSEATAEELRASHIPVTIHQRPGPMAVETIAQTNAAHYDLVVIGSQGRRGIKRLVAGSRACNVLNHATTSILAVKGRRRDEIDDILLCSAAGPTSEATVRFAARLADALEASVTLLHVMSQVALEEGANTVDLEARAEELMERDAREGVHLENMLRTLHEEGIEARVLVRHGLVLDEIMAEASKGHFDMLIIGAHATPGIRSLLVDDLSERILLTANRPVLVVQQEQVQP